MGEVSLEDAMSVFGLRDPFDEESLKRSFRAIALRVHPDRGGTAELFGTVIDCYETLSNHLRRSQGSMGHMDLKMSFDHDVRVMDGASRRDTGGFNIDKFNSVFEGSRVADQSGSGGYGDWLKSCSVGECPAPDRSSLPDADAFNRAFESRVPSSETMAVAVRPVGMNDSSALWLTEIGADCDDYSSGIGFDCRAAHANERLTPPGGGAWARRCSVSTFDAERARADRQTDIGRGMTEAEAASIAAEKRREAAVESARWRVESERHSVLASAHSRASRAMLGSA